MPCKKRQQHNIENTFYAKTEDIMRTVGYFNGEIAETEDLMIPALSRAVYLGDSC